MNNQEFEVHMDKVHAAIKRGQRTDLEIRKLCAKAIGIEASEQEGKLLYGPFEDDCSACGGSYFKNYNPFHDDEQAMALVKNLRLEIFRSGRSDWDVMSDTLNAAGECVRVNTVSSIDLNRAICECVAQMQETK